MAFGLFGGPSTGETTNYNDLTGTAGFAANEGQQDVSSSDAFMQAILSGDPAKIGQFLGPQEQAITGQAQQKKQTNAQFGNRGGGTNAQNQTIGDQSTQSINNLISSLTGSAVSGLRVRMGLAVFGRPQLCEVTLFSPEKSKIPASDCEAGVWDY